MVNTIHTHDARTALKGLYDDVQARWEALGKDLGRLTWASNARGEVKDQMLELAYEQRGLVAAIVAINGLSVGLPLGTKVYNYRDQGGFSSKNREGVVVHPREVGGEYEDSTVDEWDIDDDFFEMVPVRWDGQESATWVYFEDLARVPEL